MMTSKIYKSKTNTNRWLLITEGKRYSNEALRIYLQTHNVMVYEGEYLNNITSEIRNDIKNNIEGLVIRLSLKITKEFTSKFKSLKFIASPTTGITHIDEEVLTDKNLKIFTLKECINKISNITATGEHTVGLILGLARRTVLYNKSIIEKNEWNRELYMGSQLSNKTIGIIGLGRIGKQVAKTCKSLSMNILAYDIKEHKDKLADMKEYPYVKYTSMHELLAYSDIVSINASYKYGDAPILGKKELEIMKQGALLVNSARGELLLMEPLLKGLKNKKIGGVAVDVISNEDSWEGKIINHPLAELAREGYNIILTPHIGGCTLESMQSTETILANEVNSALVTVK